MYSPVPTGTRGNKQRAIWCNQYVTKHAASVWVGSIRPGGSLETLLNSEMRPASVMLVASEMGFGLNIIF